MKRPSGRTDGQERTFEAGNRLRVHPQTVSSPALSAYHNNSRNTIGERLKHEIPTQR